MTNNDELERQKRQAERSAYDKAVRQKGNDLLRQWVSSARWLEGQRVTARSKQEQCDG